MLWLTAQPAYAFEGRQEFIAPFFGRDVNASDFNCRCACMTAEIVNLNKFRKAREKAHQQRQADENRVRFGRTRAKKGSDAFEDQQRNRLVDGARIDPDGKTGDASFDPDEAS
jgi:hypothetical protein